MKKYELVAVVDANLSAADIKTTLATVEKLLGKSILDTDDMWLMPTAYPLLGQDQAYYTSYYVELASESIDELKSDLRLVKWLAKFTLFAMWVHENFLHMWDLQKRREDLSVEDDAPETTEAQEEKEVEVVDTLTSQE